MFNVKHIKTNITVLLKLIVIFVAIKVVIRNTVMPDNSKTTIHRLQNNAAIRHLQGTISVNGTKNIYKRYKTGSFKEDIDISEIKRVYESQDKNNLFPYESNELENGYNSKSKMMQLEYYTGNTYKVKNHFKNLKISNNQPITWDKTPPFSTHSLSELEILHFNNISELHEDTNPYIWHSKIKSMDTSSTYRQRFPRCIIIGVNKAGTLALLKFLSLHPNITIPKTNSQGKNEVKFFNIYYPKGYNFYLNEMPFSTPGQITVEKSPGYFRSSTAPQRIYRFYKGRVKLILIVRDPIDRTVSEFIQKRFMYRSKLHDLLKRNGSAFPTFEEVMTINERGRRLLKTSSKLISNSIYHQHTQRWIDTFTRDHLHIVDGDNLKTSPLQELRKIETFLGLPHELREEQFYFNRTKGFYCYKTNLDSSDVQCLKKDKGLKHPWIDPGLLEEMYQYFLPFNLAFSQLVGQDFGWVQHYLGQNLGGLSDSLAGLWVGSALFGAELGGFKR